MYACKSRWCTCRGHLAGSAPSSLTHVLPCAWSPTVPRIHAARRSSRSLYAPPGTDSGPCCIPPHHAATPNAARARCSALYPSQFHAHAHAPCSSFLPLSPPSPLAYPGPTPFTATPLHSLLFQRRPLNPLAHPKLISRSVVQFRRASCRGYGHRQLPEAEHHRLSEARAHLYVPIASPQTRAARIRYATCGFQMTSTRHRSVHPAVLIHHSRRIKDEWSPFEEAYPDDGFFAGTITWL